MPEAILEPDLPIVDPHHHMWDRPTEILRNLPPSEHGFMDIIRNTPRYLLEQLLADLKSGHNVRGTIYMECGAMYRADGPDALKCVGETEFVNGVAAMTASGLYGDVRACAGIVGHVDLRIGDAAEDVLRSHIVTFASPTEVCGLDHARKGVARNACRFCSAKSARAPPRRASLPPRGDRKAASCACWHGSPSAPPSQASRRSSDTR